jgi:hypothetical protein
MTDLKEHFPPNDPIHEKLKTTGSLGLVELNKVVESQGIQINKLFEKLEALSTSTFVELKAELEHQLPCHKPQTFMAFFQALNMGKEIHQDRALQLKFAVDAFFLLWDKRDKSRYELEKLFGICLLADKAVVNKILESRLKPTCDFKDVSVLGLCRSVFYKFDLAEDPKGVLADHSISVKGKYIVVGMDCDLITSEEFSDLQQLEGVIELIEWEYSTLSIAFPWF